MEGGSKLTESQKNGLTWICCSKLLTDGACEWVGCASTVTAVEGEGQVDMATLKGVCRVRSVSCRKWWLTCNLSSWEERVVSFGLSFSPFASGHSFP